MWLARRWADPRMETCRCWDCGGGPAVDGLLLTGSIVFRCSHGVATGGVMARGIFVAGTDGITTFLVLLLWLRLLPPACFPRTTRPMITSYCPRDRQSCRCCSILLIG